MLLPVAVAALLGSSAVSRVSGCVEILGALAIVDFAFTDTVEAAGLLAFADGADFPWLSSPHEFGRVPLAFR